jgi:hypothetical protein
MRRAGVVAFLLVALVGCSGAKSDRVPEGLWYAQSEEPDAFHYHVYVLFLDESHFTWWRTNESYETVMKRWAYYTHDHPGVRILSSYARDGDKLTGVRRIVTTGTPSVRANTFPQTFTGRFTGDALNLTVETMTTYENGPLIPTEIVRWPLRHLNLPPSQ